MDFFNNRKAKKSAKVESFFRRKFSSLPHSLRHYENCVIESKGSLVLSYAILTNDSLLVTQNTPSSFSHIIPLPFIQDISLVADRQSLVRSRSPNDSFICQHVRILYEDTTGSIGNGKVLDNLTYSMNTSRASSVLSKSKDSTSHDEFIRQQNQLPLSIQQVFDPGYNTSSSQRAESEFSSDDTIKDVTNKIFDSETETNDSTSIVVNKSCSTKIKPTASKISESISSRPQSILGRKLNFWKKKKDANDLEKRPSSDDISQTSMLRRILFFGKTFSKKRGIPLTKLQHARTIELDLYLYHANSTFLNELILCWNRQVLTYLPGGVGTDVNFQQIQLLLHHQEKQSNDSIYMAETIFQRMINDEIGGLKILFSSKSIEMKRRNDQKLLSLLNLLHGAIQKYDYLAFMCHKKSALLMNLQMLLESCTIGEIDSHSTDEVDLKQFSVPRRVTWENGNSRTSQKTIERKSMKEFGTNRKKVGDATTITNNINLLVTKVSTRILLMEILRLLLLQESTGFVHTNQSTLISFEELLLVSNNGTRTRHMNMKLGPEDKSSNRRRVYVAIPDNNQIIEIILNSIFTFPSLMEFNFSTKCLQIMNRHCCLNLGESNSEIEMQQLIKVLCINHNASTALLYDILTVAYFSQEKAKTRIQSLTEVYNLEPYLKQSVSQLVNILWSSSTFGSTETLTIAQCTLFHRQLVVLNYLIQSSKLVKDFMQQNFFEEFKYFINLECTTTKIPPEYRMKRKLLGVCDKIRSSVTQAH